MTPVELHAVRRYLAPWQIVRVMRARTTQARADVRAGFLAGMQGGAGGDVWYSTHRDGIQWRAGLADGWELIRWREVFSLVHRTADARPDLADGLARACRLSLEHTLRHVPLPWGQRAELLDIWRRHYGDAYQATGLRLHVAELAARDAFWAAAEAREAEPRDLLELLAVTS